MKIQRALGLLFLGMALILTACKVENTADTTTELAQNKNSTTSGVDTTATEITPDEEGSVVRGTPDDHGLGQLEYWDIDEFEIWMEQQHERNQRLADNHEKSFYDKGANGGYYCREWTQEDVDTLYGQWQEQSKFLLMMSVGFLAYLGLKQMSRPYRPLVPLLSLYQTVQGLI